MVGSSRSSSAFPVAAKSAPKPSACAVSDPGIDEGSDLTAVMVYKAAIRQLFRENKFADLDCIADNVRSGKSRFAGGRWKLNVLYWAIEEPEGHATEEDWKAHLKILNHWVAAKPRSITARIALADAYTSYAWNARGSGYSDTVTESGWKLFAQRIGKAKEILEQASKLSDKCPQWYAVMQKVALAEGWDLDKATALLEQAVASEPDYYYYYRNHANYLKPQWNGAEGDAETFARQAADRVGGAKGDILYFQIANELICHCGVETNLKLMSWKRIQKGVAELEKQNGSSDTNLNLLAYMAIKENDAVVAHNLFSRLSDNWDEDTWKTRRYFNYCKDWAEQTAAYLGTPGQQIFQAAQTNFADAIQQCAQTGDGDVTKFALFLTLQANGIVDGVTPLPQTKVGLCLMKLKGEPLPAPPYAPYTFKLNIDPAAVIRASTR